MFPTTQIPNWVSSGFKCKTTMQVYCSPLPAGGVVSPLTVKLVRFASALTRKEERPHDPALECRWSLGGQTGLPATQGLPKDDQACGRPPGARCRSQRQRRRARCCRLKPLTCRCPISTAKKTLPTRAPNFTLDYRFNKPMFMKDPVQLFSILAKEGSWKFSTR